MYTRQQRHSNTATHYCTVPSKLYSFPLLTHHSYASVCSGLKEGRCFDCTTQGNHTTPPLTPDSLPAALQTHRGSLRCQEKAHLNWGLCIPTMAQHTNLLPAACLQRTEPATDQQVYGQSCVSHQPGCRCNQIHSLSH